MDAFLEAYRDGPMTILSKCEGSQVYTLAFDRASNFAFSTLIFETEAHLLAATTDNATFDQSKLPLGDCVEGPPTFSDWTVTYQGAE